MSNYGDRLLQPMRQQIYDRLSQFQAACDKQFADLRLELTHSITQLTDQLVEDLQLQLISERDEPNNPIHFTTDDDNDVAFCCVDEDILYDETLDGDSEAMVDADSDDAFADAHTLEGQLDDDVANDIEGPSLTLKLETGFDNDDNDDNATVDAAVADVQPPPAKRRRASKKVYQCEICAYIVADRHRFQLHQLSSHGHSARFVSICADRGRYSTCRFLSLSNTQHTTRYRRRWDADAGAAAAAHIRVRPVSAALHGEAVAARAHAHAHRRTAVHVSPVLSQLQAACAVQPAHALTPGGARVQVSAVRTGVSGARLADRARAEPHR